MYDFLNNCNVSVDWLRGVVCQTDVNAFLHYLEKIDSRLSFDNFKYEGRGMLNFRHRFSHVECPSLCFSFNSAHPMFNPEDPTTFLACEKGIGELVDGQLVFAPGTDRNPYILVNFSGDAIRFLGAESFKKICYKLYHSRFDCTRLDLALDFFDKNNKFVPMLQDALSHFVNPKRFDITIKSQFERHPKNIKCWQNVYEDGTVTSSYTLGNHGSNHGMFRLYDKKHEILYGRHSDRSTEMLKGRNYWYRAELELHRSDRKAWAGIAFKSLIESDFNVWNCYGNSIKSFFNVISLVYDNLHHINLSDNTSLWDYFLEFACSIDFVEFAVEKFVHNEFDKAMRALYHFKKQILMFLKLEELHPDLAFAFSETSEEFYRVRGQPDPSHFLDSISREDLEKYISA